jgi:hypothetical protein
LLSQSLPSSYQTPRLTTSHGLQKLPKSTHLDKGKLPAYKTDGLLIVHGLLIRCSVLPTDDATPKAGDRQKSLGAYFRIKFRSSPMRSMIKRLESTSEAPYGIFGIEMTISIRYANVAISLFNDEGQPYLYGYIPIVVAKTGVFLKEKGKCDLGSFEPTLSR